MRKGIISIISGIVFMTMVSLQACPFGEWETGSIREISGFENVSFATAGELIITQGDSESLEIESWSSELVNIVTEVRDGTLTIGRRGAEPFSPFRAPVFRLTVKKIAVLEAHSSGGYAGGQLESRSAIVRVSSSGSATLRVSDSLEAVVTSSGNVRYHGNPMVRNLRVTSSGRAVRLGD